MMKIDDEGMLVDHRRMAVHVTMGSGRARRRVLMAMVRIVVAVHVLVF